MSDLRPSQPRFFSQQSLASLQYFKQGKQFTSSKQIQTTITKIYHDSKELCFLKGNLLFSEGQKSDYGYFLLEGSIALISSLSDQQIFNHKYSSQKLTENDKRQLIANVLDIKATDIKFNINIFCPGNMMEKRVFMRLEAGSVFGLSELLKSGIRSFTAITTGNCKLIIFHKKQFESVLSAYELKRQDLAITPMCKQFVGSRGKQFLFEVFPHMVKQCCSFNQILYNQGDSPYAIYFIVKGQFQIYKRQKNKQSILVSDLQNIKQLKDLEIPIRKKQQGEFIGMQEIVLKIKHRQFTVKSTQSSVIYKIQAQKFLYYLDDFLEIKKGLQKYINEMHERNLSYMNKVFGNIQSGFKFQESTHLEDERKLAETVHREIYSGKKRGNNKSRSNERIRGYSVNMNVNYQPDEKRIVKSFVNINNLNHPNEQQQNPLTFITPQKVRSKSIDLRKQRSMRNTIDNNIKIDEKAYKRVMIKMGTYNSQSKNTIFRVGSQYKNNFEPIIDEIVRRHNTFLTKLDQKQRRQFVESKFREVVDKKEHGKGNDKDSTMYKTWTVRSMKKSMKKYQQTFDVPLYTQQKRGRQPTTERERDRSSHNEILSKFDGIVCPSSTRMSRTSRGGNREISQQLFKRESARRDSAKSSNRNKLVLVNHMMKPLVYFHNN